MSGSLDMKARLNQLEVQCASRKARAVGSEAILNGSSGGNVRLAGACREAARPYVRGLTISVLDGCIRIGGRAETYCAAQAAVNRVLEILKSVSVRHQVVSEIEVPYGRPEYWRALD